MLNCPINGTINLFKTEDFIKFLSFELSDTFELVKFLASALNSLLKQLLKLPFHVEIR